MTGSAQKSAVNAYRKRLARRGVARFEVLGREADRDLIRSVAKHLASDGPEASALRDAIRRSIGSNPAKKGGVLSPFAARRRRSHIRTAAHRRQESLDVTDYILDTNIVSGVTKLAPSQRLVDWLAAQDDQGGRILSFDSRAALEWAELMAEGDRKERPRSAIDMMIAAVARANDCVVVTGNARDFAGVEVFNPLN
jgi:predicted nucleic acid-binding protein